MSRIKLKCGGRPKRKKALFGEAITAAATLAAAGIQAAATNSAAKTQSKAVIDNANAQKEALLAQNANNNQLQQQQIEFTRQQNAEIKQQQQDIQASLQMLAGQQNMNDRMEANKMQVKYGGRPKRRKLKQSLPYGGGNQPFEVTDGGGAIPLNIDANGYGLYELYGNDHEHYHKTRGGKNKTGVGIKFANGEVIEGEGNQNSNQGEYLYIEEVPERIDYNNLYFDRQQKAFGGNDNIDAMFISKHSIGGFNPAKAVNQGMHPKQAFAIQEHNKAVLGYNDDGTKAKCGGRRKLKAMMGMISPVSSTTRNAIIPVNTAAIAAGAAYAKDRNSSPVAKCGKRVSLRKKADYGLNTKATIKYPSTLSKPTTTNSSNSSNFLNNYGGATINAAGNLAGAGLSWLGGNIAANRLSRAYNRAGNILADAYGQLKTVDMSFLNKDDFQSNATAIAAIRDPNYRNTAIREKMRRNAAARFKEASRNTFSSAARQNRLASIQDSYNQAVSELAEQEANINEQTKQGNAERITDVSKTNAQIKANAIRDYYAIQSQIAQYNNDIENMKITGAAQARADALSQGATVKADAFQAGMNSLAGAIGASGQAFGAAYDQLRKDKKDYISTHVGLGDDKQLASAEAFWKLYGDDSLLQSQYEGAYGRNDDVSKNIISNIDNIVANMKKTPSWYKKNANITSSATAPVVNYPITNEMLARQTLANAGMIGNYSSFGGNAVVSGRRQYKPYF